MDERRNRRGSWWRAAALALMAAAGACSTQNVTLKATVGEQLNPNLAGGAGVLDVYAFFLTKTAAFEANDRLRGDFLVDSVRSDKKPPAFLEADTIAIEVMQIAPAEHGDWPVVEKVVEVPVGATHVGLVALFQTHNDNDSEERWKLLVPVSGSTVAFQVAGRQLALPVDAPSASQPKTKPKEAPRAGTNER